MKKMTYLQVKKPWRMLDNSEGFRTYTGRQTVDAYYAYYLTKLFKQQHNVNNRYMKHMYYLILKSFIRSHFRRNLQVQPYQLVMYPFYQVFKPVYLKDTVFNAQFISQNEYRGFTITKKIFNFKFIKNTNSLKYTSLLYGGKNYIISPEKYKYGIYLRMTSTADKLNDMFKKTASFKNIIWMSANKYTYFNISNFFFFLVFNIFFLQLVEVYKFFIYLTIKIK